MAAAGASLLCWGAAGAVHLGFEHHGSGRQGGWSLPEGGGWYEFALVAGVLVTLYSVPGLLRRAAWWPSLALSLGSAVGVVSVLALGQGTRHWVAASAMIAVGLAAPVVNRVWGRHHTIAGA